MLVRRSTVALRLVVERQIAEADGLAVAGAVDDETRDAARDEVRHPPEVLDLLGDVEAVEKDHRRGATGGPFRVDVERGEARALVWHLDVLDPRTPEVPGRVAKGLDAAPVGRESHLALGLKEPLADVIVMRGTQEATRGRRRVSSRESLATHGFYALGHPRPLLEPRPVVAETVAQAVTDAVDLVELTTAPRRRRERQAESVRPAVVLGEVHERELIRVRHAIILR